MNMDKIEIIATGPEFIIQGARSFESAMENLIMEARKEIHIVAYMMTTSALPLIKKLKQVMDKGVTVTLLLNNDDNDVNIKNFLLEMKENYTPLFKMVNFYKRTQKNIHAKIIISDRKKAIIGSANFSWGGFTGNYEMGVLVTGETAWKIAKMIDSLIEKISDK